MEKAIVTGAKAMDEWNIAELDALAAQVEADQQAARERRAAEQAPRGWRAQIAALKADAPISIAPNRAVQVHTGVPASEKQVAFLVSLLKDRQHDRDGDDLLNAAGDRRYASALIEHLLACPKVTAPVAPQPPKPLPDVPAGRYAVDNEDGELRFYHVDRPAEGRWAGYTFLSVLASSEEHPIKGRDAKAAIMAKIAADPQAAMERYGREIGRCGHCGRTLTDAASRARGIGPICAGRMGW